MVKQLVLILVAVCFVSAFASSFASAQEGSQGNSIRGKVLRANGKPAALVVVVIESATGIPVGQTTTNSEGDFFIGGLLESTYSVVVKEVDYYPASEAVNFGSDAGGDRPGESIHVTVTISPIPGSRAANPGLIFVQNVPAAARSAYETGMKQSRANETDNAIGSFRQAITAFADYFDAHFALANELIKKGDYNGAFGELDKARTINPKDDRVYGVFGMVLARQKKYSVAAAAFGEASRLNPGDPQHPLMRATVLIDEATLVDPSQKDGAATRSQLLEGARVDLDHAFELSSHQMATVHLQRARMYERMGDKAKAADSLEAYLKQVPKAANAAAIRESIKKLRGQ